MKVNEIINRLQIADKWTKTLTTTACMNDGCKLALTNAQQEELASLIRSYKELLNNQEVEFAAKPSCDSQHICCSGGRTDRKESLDDVIHIHAANIEDGVRYALCENPLHNERGCDGNCMINENRVRDIVNLIFACQAKE